MKKIILVTFIVLVTSNATFAQGLLGKLKDKVSQTAGGGKAGDYFLPNAKAAQKDLETAELEKIDFSSDKTGLSGVYISQKEIGLYGEKGAFGPPQKSIKKLAIQFSPTGKSITISSNLTKEGVKPLLIRSLFGGNVHEKLEAEMIKKKFFFQYNMEEVDAASRAHELIYIDNLYQFGKEAPFAFDFKQNFTVLEPGVIVMHEYVRMEDSKKCTNPMFNNNSNDEYKTLPFNLLYKEGQNISKWTKEAIKAKLFEMAKTYCQLNNGTASASTQMPAKAAAFKEQPTSAAMLKAVQNRAKQYGWKENVTLVYATGNWRNDIKPLGTNQLPTLVSRTHAGIAVLKDESGCYIIPINITQDNAYTVGSMAENYAGKELYCSANSTPENIDCARAK